MSSRSLRLLAFALISTLAACTGAEVTEAPRVPRELLDEVASNDQPRSPQDDFWTEISDDYLSPEDLHRYWVTDTDRRFKQFGIKWLEFSLRQELIDKNRDDLSPEDVGHVCKAKGYDASRESLRQILGRDPE